MKETTTEQADKISVKKIKLVKAKGFAAPAVITESCVVSMSSEGFANMAGLVYAVPDMSQHQLEV